jgi:sulfane dehydrogenase subunit SoxC
MSTNREIISHQKPKGRPDDRQPTSGRLTRRQSLKGSAGLLGGLVLGSLGRSHVAEGHVPEHAVPPDPTKVLGHSSSDYGFRSQFEGHVLRQRVPIKDEAPAASWTPLHDARGIITPSALHFEVHHGGVPVIDPAKHTLIIHGLVERPLKLTLSDLMRFPAVSHIYFLVERFVSSSQVKPLADGKVAASRITSQMA